MTTTSKREPNGDRRFRRLATLTTVLLFAPLAFGAMGAGADDGSPILPPDTMAVAPCLKGFVAVVDVRVCFHSPGDYVAVAGFEAGTYTATAEVWSYRVSTAPADGDSNDIIIPCFVVSFARPESNAAEADCDSFAEREERIDGATYYVHTYNPPELGVLGYLVEVQLDVLVEGFGIDDEETLLLCKDPECTRI